MGYVLLILEEKSAEKLMSVFETILGQSIDCKIVNISKEVAEVKDIAVDFKGKSKEKENIKDGVAELLHTIGMPVHCSGYKYIVDAVMLAVEDPTVMRFITKRLYPKIAEINDSTPYRIERNIRNVIEATCTSSNSRKMIMQIFGYTSLENKHKITNSEFLNLVIEKIRLDYGL